MVIVGAFLGAAALFHPDSPLDRGWNPLAPLHVDDAVTPFTDWKLAQATADRGMCLAVLGQTARFSAKPDLVSDTQGCGILNTVDLAGIGAAGIGPVQTSCATALRTAMWERHGLRPAARDILGAELARIDDIGSYNCRRMRTSSGASTRMSSHATARAIDVTGFRFADGSSVRLIDDWGDPGPTGAFLRAARDSACRWFRVTLGPDYNSLHADHFHLQVNGWGACR